MREIKFRGRRLDNGEWVIGSYIEAENRDLSIAHQIVPYESGEAVREVDPNTVGQFTGLKDKNGREIYEGDIIECIGSDNEAIRHLVRYNDAKGGYGQLLFMDNDLTREPYDGGLISQNYICEMGKYIIGNIHDNPGSLNGTI